MNKSASKKIVFADLSEVALFSKLSGEEIENVQRLGTRAEYRSGRYLVSEGQNDGRLIFLLRGNAKVARVSKGGKEVILAHLSPGDYIGEISLFTGTPRTADVIAESSCLTIEFSKEKFLEHTVRFTGLTLAMMEVMAGRLHTTSARVVDSTFLDVYTRLLKQLYEMSSIVELNGVQCRMVRECPPHQQLAASVGTSREVITRTLKQLEKDGCIARNDKQIVLRDFTWQGDD